MDPYVNCFRMYSSLNLYSNFVWTELFISKKVDIQELDAVSVQWGGLPDSLLKPCMLAVFNRNLSETSTGWMRQHLEALIK